MNDDGRDRRLAATDREPAVRRRLAVAAALLIGATGNVAALPRHAPVPGGLAVLKVGDAARPAPQVSFGERPQPVVRYRGHWFVLIGIPLDAGSGNSEARVSDADGQWRLPFAIRAKRYPTQQLHIPDRKLVDPPPELAARISEEKRRLDALKQHFTPAGEPDTDFSLPAAGRLSGRFGSRRIFNGQARAPHSGLDLAIPAGTPLRAPAAGTVLAVEDFYFAGKTVLIDHGQGVLTLYAHLARVDVGIGDSLRRGDLIGSSGASGRATGPHLHWGVIIGGNSIDPELFIDTK